MPIPNYFPFMHGVYDVKAGITALGRDHGNGEVDAQVFQRDEQFDVYHAAKQASAMYPDQHILREGLCNATENTIAQWMVERITTDHPKHDALQRDKADTLDGLAIQVQEDLAVLQIDEQGGNRLVYLNINMPSGWAPEDKLGKPFDVVHTPVPHIDPINAKQDSIAKLMVNATRGAVRFAWTITTDSALNHHPKRDRTVTHPTPLPAHPPGEPLLRVERQVIWGFPEHQAALFTIRTYLYPFGMLDSKVRSALAQAVSGMSEASLAYKNMDRALVLDRLGKG